MTREDPKEAAGAVEPRGEAAYTAAELEVRERALDRSAMGKGWTLSGVAAVLQAISTGTLFTLPWWMTALNIVAGMFALGVLAGLFAGISWAIRRRRGARYVRHFGGWLAGLSVMSAAGSGMCAGRWLSS